MYISVREQLAIAYAQHHLSLNVTVTLTFDLETPNSIGVIY